jgi:hypothetical protein
VFAADTVDNWSHDTLVEAFRQARQEGFSALAAEIERTLRRLAAPRRSRGKRAPAVERLLAGFRQRLAGLEQIDFFGSAGRNRVRSLLTQLEDRTRPAAGRIASNAADATADRTAFQRRLWVTRPRPGVDRMSSAWLVRRFIDPEARFAFAADRGALPPGDPVPFDMFGVEFSHDGGRCTFETLCYAFGLQDPALSRIAELVHDLDLKDGKFGAADAGTVGALIDGLQLATIDDDALLERGMLLFESLYLVFAHAARRTAPRQVRRKSSAS